MRTKSRIILGLVCLAFFPPLFMLHSFYQSVRTIRLYTSDDQGAVPSTGQDSHNILLVTALFPLSKAKHSMDDYRSWGSRFLGTVKPDIYFFTTPELAPLITELRGNLSITINTTYSSPYDIPPLSGLKHRYEEMHKIDRENSYHSPELYAVWNGKAYYLDEGWKNSKKTYKYAFWTDAGGFRNEHVYEYWPDYQRLEDIWTEGSRMTGVQKQDLFFIPTFQAVHPSKKDWQEQDGPVDIDSSEGSFFGGQREAVRWWRRTFYAYHDHYLSKGMFVGKDQTLYNALIMLFSRRMISVWLADPIAPAHKGLSIRPEDGTGSLGNCGSEWYYYEFFLSDPYTRKRTREIWDAEAGDKDSGLLKKTCRLTRLVSIRDLLARQFGKGWNPPDATVLNHLKSD